MRYSMVPAALLVIALGSTAGAVLSPGQLCEKNVAGNLRSCANAVVKRQLDCIQSTGVMCAGGDATIAAKLSRLGDRVLARCPDAPTMASAGYPVALTPAGLVARIQEACTSTAATLVARAFGGPQVAVRATATPADQACLDVAYDQGRRFLTYALRQQSACVVAAHLGKVCDPAKVATKIGEKSAKYATTIGASCPDLASLVTVDPTAFLARAASQAECLVATAHGQTAPLTLACGPRAAVPVPPLATDTQVVLDSNTWGTRCGDGSDYAFTIRLAPSGQPVNRVVVFIAGGGSCVDGPDCAATAPNLFEALSDGPGATGLLTSTVATNPFEDWTKVFLPYCTQDGHTGGGVVNAFPEMTVYRYGALNVRATMRYVRDVLWASMDATDPEGFRPDRLTVVFSGSSAGGDGAQFNYHYLLDDLRWVHTTLVADSSVSLDNGAGSAAQRATLAFMPTTPGWGAYPYAPPYCRDVACGEGWNTLMLAQSARLKAVPEQQILTVTNQIDSTQKATQGFSTMRDFTNALRTKYCEQQGTTGLHSYLKADSTASHGHIHENPDFNNWEIGGTLLRDWLGDAMANPDAVIDKVATGTLEADWPGVNPFPCTVGSPSGAFVD
jgi:pectinacetylesterase